MQIEARRPGFGHLSYSLRRYYVDTYLATQVGALAPGARVLDLGGHRRRKRGAFEIQRLPLQVWVANLVVARGADVQCDAQRLPLARHAFDAVLCAEVLEHVWAPRLVVAEAFRVLRPGGVFLATVPFLFHIHGDPHDYGRYTPAFWRRTLTDAGFSSIEVVAQGGFHAVQVNMLEQYLNQLTFPRPTGRLVRWLLARLLAAPAKRLALWYESRPRIQAHPFFRSFATGYGLRGVKLS